MTRDSVVLEVHVRRRDLTPFRYHFSDSEYAIDALLEDL